MAYSFLVSTLADRQLFTRICPGRYMAVNSLFIVIAHLCYYFDIKAKDGVEVDTQAYTTGINVSLFL